MPPIINKDRCNGCGICADVCQMDVFLGSSKGEVPHIKYPEECWHCNACVLDCKKGAIILRVPLPAMMLNTD